MAHKFDPNKMEYLNRADRAETFSADRALQITGCREGDVVADIGCGTGYLSIPAAKIIGNSGRVYGVDISNRMIEHLERRAREEELHNIIPLVSGEYDFPEDVKGCDIAIMSSVFHEVDDRIRFAESALSVLGLKGRLIIFEMKPGVSAFGPPEHHRITAVQVEQDLQTAGYEVNESGDMNEYYYYVIGIKK